MRDAPKRVTADRARGIVGQKANAESAGVQRHPDGSPELEWIACQGKMWPNQTPLLVLDKADTDLVLAYIDQTEAEVARLREIVTTLAVGKERNAKPSPAPGDDR